MIQNFRGERQRGRDGGQQSQPWSLGLQDIGFQSRRGELHGRVPSASEILFFALLQIAARAWVAGKLSLFVWFS